MLASTIILFLLASGFYFIIPERENMGSRLMFATIASGFPILFWCLWYWNQLLSPFFKNKTFIASLYLVFFISGYKANLVTTIDALNYAEYLHSVQSIVLPYLEANPKMKQIHFLIPPTEDYPYNKFFLINAVLKLSPNRINGLKWCRTVRAMKKTNQEEDANIKKCLDTLPERVIALTFSQPNELFIKTPHMLVMKEERPSVWPLFGSESTAC